MTASCGIYANPYCSMTCGNGLKRYQNSAKESHYPKGVLPGSPAISRTSLGTR